MLMQGNKAKKAELSKKIMFAVILFVFMSGSFISAADPAAPNTQQQPSEEQKLKEWEMQYYKGEDFENFRGMTVDAILFFVFFSLIGYLVCSKISEGKNPGVSILMAIAFGALLTQGGLHGASKLGQSPLSTSMLYPLAKALPYIAVGIAMIWLLGKITPAVGGAAGGAAGALGGISGMFSKLGGLGGIFKILKWAAYITAIGWIWGTMGGALTTIAPQLNTAAPVLDAFHKFSDVTINLVTNPSKAMETIKNLPASVGITAKKGTETCSAGKYAGWKCTDLTKFTCKTTQKGLCGKGKLVCAKDCKAK